MLTSYEDDSCDQLPLSAKKPESFVILNNGDFKPCSYCSDILCRFISNGVCFEHLKRELSCDVAYEHDRMMNQLFGEDGERLITTPDKCKECDDPFVDEIPTFTCSTPCRPINGLSCSSVSPSSGLSPCIRCHNPMSENDSSPTVAIGDSKVATFNVEKHVCTPNVVNAKKRLFEEESDEPRKRRRLLPEGVRARRAGY